MANELDTFVAAARIYAESLLALALEAGQADEIGRELADLRELWHREPAFASLMKSAAIDDDSRREAIRKAFGNGRVSQLVLNLMLVLNQKRRAMILPWVCDAYRKKLDEKHGRDDVHVTTATPLGEAQRETIRAQVKRLTGSDAILIEKVDPDVLGGVRIQVGDRLFDMTIRSRLRDMRAYLLASSDRHLRAGTSRFVMEG
ncbi:MAG: ATP synthase F1 subunit delta [Planctomycetes bacterium]|nr:ATP synthase F1 subunit delta [Planctomycetota bacterium]